MLPSVPILKLYTNDEQLWDCDDVPDTLESRVSFRISFCPGGIRSADQKGPLAKLLTQSQTLKWTSLTLINCSSMRSANTISPLTQKVRLRFFS